MAFLQLQSEAPKKFLWEQAVKWEAPGLLQRRSHPVPLQRRRNPTLAIIFALPLPHLEAKAGTGWAMPAAPGEHVPEEGAGASVTIVLFPHPRSLVELPKQPCPLLLVSPEPTLT